MTMLCGKVTVPDTSGDMTVKAIPIVSVGGAIAESISIADDPNIYILTGYTTFAPISGTVFVYAKHGADPDDDTSWPTAQFVVDNGMPAKPELPFYLQDIGGSPQPDARLYFVAKSGAGSADLRIGN